MKMTLSKDTLDIEIKDSIKSPKKEEDISQKVDDLKILFPGSVVTKTQIEFILDCKYIDQEDWRFRREYYRLKEIIEGKGYFITQKGMQIPEFRVLNSKEMPEQGLKKLCKATKDIFKVHYVLKTHDRSEMDDRDKKMYNHILNKSAMLALAHQKILLKNQEIDEMIEMS